MNLKSFKNSNKGGIKCNKLISKIWKKGVTIKQFKKNFGQNIKKRYQKPLGHPPMLGTHLHVEHL